jgi:hypothetical protein
MQKYALPEFLWKGLEKSASEPQKPPITAKILLRSVL